MNPPIILAWNYVFHWTKKQIKSLTKPLVGRIVLGSLFDITRTRTDLIAENALLRQQLIILKRQIKRPQLSNRDRLSLVLLARCTKFWKQAVFIIQPDTLLRWHRDLFRLFWRWKSKSRRKKPRISPSTIALIKKMAGENQLWGAERIRGELLKLGIRVSKRTVQRYLPKDRRNSGQTWSTFIKNNSRDIWACDFTVVHDLLFRPLYVFVIIELHTRRIVHAAVTRSPTDQWTAQQLREATPWGVIPKYLIRDRDNKYGAHFAAAARSIKILTTPVQAPRANSFCERFIGSLRRECLDHMLILHRNQLHRILQEYVKYFNQSRPHQGIGQQIPEFIANGDPWPVSQPAAGGKITSTPILGGLHHCYAWAATSSH